MSLSEIDQIRGTHGKIGSADESFEVTNIKNTVELRTPFRSRLKLCLYSYNWNRGQNLHIYLYVIQLEHTSSGIQVLPHLSSRLQAE